MRNVAEQQYSAWLNVIRRMRYADPRVVRCEHPVVVSRDSDDLHQVDTQPSHPSNDQAESRPQSVRCGVESVRHRVEVTGKQAPVFVQPQDTRLVAQKQTPPVIRAPTAGPRHDEETKGQAPQPAYDQTHAVGRQAQAPR